MVRKICFVTSIFLLTSSLSFSDKEEKTKPKKKERSDKVEFKWNLSFNTQGAGTGKT